MAQRLLGKEVNEAMNQRIRDKIAVLADKGVTPALCTIRVGEDPGDISYEKSALKRCQSLGIEGKSIVLPVDVTQEELLSVIDQVNQDKLIHGVLLFRPLPRHLDAKVIENALSPEKDVDGMTDLSMASVISSRVWE